MKYFTTFFLKSIDKLQKLLYYPFNLRGVILIQKLFNLFLFVFLFNIIIVSYIIYIFFVNNIFHTKQGSKLKIKQQELK